MNHPIGLSWAEAQEAAALDAQFIPGTNRRGELSDADWRFLLPAHHFNRILFLGSPTPAVLSAIASLGRTAVVLLGDPESAQAVDQSIRRSGQRTLQAVHEQQSGRLPFADASFDLVVAPRGPGAPRLQRAPGLVTEIERVLAPDGLVYFESAGILDALSLRRWAARWEARGTASARLLWLVPRRGGIWAAMPVEDAPRTARYLFDHVLHGGSRRGRTLLRVARLLARARLLHRTLPHRAVLLRRGRGGESQSEPFSYLEALGKGAGIDPAGYRIGFFARGRYNSNKVTLFLFDRTAAVPEIVVKMTRTSEYNARLENEHRSLALLRANGHMEPGTYPEPLFLGHHRGLAALGETVVHGSPFRNRTTNEPGCPYARQAVDWLLRLGTVTADRATATPEEVATWLMRLVTRFTEIYAPSPGEAAFLRDRISIVAQSRTPFPLVFRHADPGTGNILVTANERVAFLDWESSEPQGLPLWDLFYFIRSFGIGAARARGEQDATAAYAEHFLASTPISALHAKATQRYCASLGLERCLVEPLFYTCWIDRALREAAWASGPLEQATFFRLLKLCMQQRTSPGLARIFLSHPPPMHTD